VERILELNGALPALDDLLRERRPMLRDPRLLAIAEKMLTSERLGFDDGMAVLATDDVPGAGLLADAVRTSRHGDHTYFVFNRQINPTNYCVLDCCFCDYAKRPKDPTGYEMSLDEVAAHAEGGVSEVHVVGGLHPKWKYEHYLDIVRRIRTDHPGVQIKAYTAVEIDFFTRLARKSVEEVFTDLRQAGLDSLPGGGAEVFSERVRRHLFPQKIGHERWLEIHRIAHRMGIRSNCTLLYGHIESYEERVDHVLKLRGLEDEAPGFFAFIPLAFQPGTTGIRTRQAPPLEDLRTIAMSRLLFDNVPHVKSYWVMLGEQTASIGLNFGASDLDGTIGVERIAHAALASSPLGLARARLLELIREAGRIPVERDALYRVVRVYGRHAEPDESEAEPPSIPLLAAPVSR
jgi:aminodeoxyfutalosine synthase